MNRNYTAIPINYTAILIPDGVEPLVVAIPLLVSCVIAVIFNVFVCYLILSVRRLKTATNVFVFSLCVCDILFAGVLLPFHCFYHNSLIYMYLVLITILVYFCNLSAVTYERLFSITQPMKYYEQMTIKIAVRMTVAAWIIPIVYCFLPILWNNDVTTLQHKVFLACTLTLFLILPLFFIVYVYIRIFFEIKRVFRYKNNLANKTEEAQNCNMCCCFKFIMQKSSNVRDNIYRKRSTLPTISQESSVDTILPSDFDENDGNTSCHNDEQYFQSRDLESFISNTVSPDTIDRNKVKSQDRLTQTHQYGTNNFEKSSQKNEIVVDTKPFKMRFLVIKNNYSIKSCTKRKVKNMKMKIRELKASLPFGIVTLTYMLTWIPVVVMTFNVVTNRPDLTPPSLAIFSIFAIGFNALSDPLLYGLLLRSFRKVIVRTMNKAFTCQ